MSKQSINVLMDMLTQQYEDGMNILMCALSNYQFEVAELIINILLEQPNQSDAFIRLLIQIQKNKDNVNSLMRVVLKQPKVAERIMSFLSNQSNDAIKDLLAQRNTSGMTILMLALKNKQTRLAVLIIDALSRYSEALKQTLDLMDGIARPNYKQLIAKFESN